MTGSDHWDGKVVRGEIVGAEFIGTDDEQQRDAGVYITIRLVDEKAAVVGGPCEVTYLPVTQTT